MENGHHNREVGLHRASPNDMVDRSIIRFPFGSTSHPRCSMYGIFTYICPKNDTNVGKYSIHGASGHFWTNSCIRLLVQKPNLLYPHCWLVSSIVIGSSSPNSIDSWFKSLFLTIKSWEFHISAASSFNSTQVTHPNNALRMKSIEIPPDPSEMVGFLFYPTDPHAKIIPRYPVAAAPPAPFAPRSVPPALPAPPSVPSPRGGRGCAAAAGARRRAPQPVWRQRWGPRQAGKGSPRVTIMWVFLAVVGPKMSWADKSDGAFMCFCWSWILMCETGIEYILLQELSET